MDAALPESVYFLSDLVPRNADGCCGSLRA